MEVAFSVLCIHQIEVDAACVDSYRCAGLHPSVGNAMSGDGFCQLVRCGFCHSSAGQLVAAYVHESVQKCSCGQYDTFRFECDTPKSDESDYFTVFNEQFTDGILPDMKVGSIFQFLTP